MAKKQREKTHKEIAKEYAGQIREELDRWKYLYEHGGSDPFWPDGVNLNLTRNHIIYAKRKCEELLLPEEYPCEYYADLPPEVDDRYMARKEEIKRNAVKTLETYKGNADYIFLKGSVGKLDPKDREATHAATILRYVSGLEDSIRSGEFVSMRRHESPDRYLDSFRKCRKKVEELIEEPDAEKELPPGQLSLFDLFGLT